MIYHKGWLSNMRSNGTNMRFVTLPNGDSVAVSDIGDCCLQNNIYLRNFVYVPTFEYNLISVSQLCRDLNYSFKFGLDSVEL